MQNKFIAWDPYEAFGCCLGTSGIPPYLSQSLEDASTPLIPDDVFPTLLLEPHVKSLDSE